jgi:ligand-binding SRPBCC domain-containing protein
MPRFEASAFIQAPVEVVFAFHEKPEAFETLLPPRRAIEILRREGGLADHGEIEFRIRVFLFWVRWLARHTAYEKNRFFVDEQVKGPFRRWVHRHEFQAEGGGTRLADSVDYNLPGGAAVEIAAGWAVRLGLKRMFAFRHRVTKRIAERMALEATRMKPPRTPPDPTPRSQTS